MGDLEPSGEGSVDAGTRLLGAYYHPWATPRLCSTNSPLPPHETAFLPSAHPIQGQRNVKMSTGAKHQEGKGKYAKNPMLPLQKGKHAVTILVRKHQYF